MLLFMNHPSTGVFGFFPRLHFVLSGFALHLASHFGRSFSDHSQGYDVSNDLPNCFASYTANSGSLVKYADQGPLTGPICATLDCGLRVLPES